MKPGPHGPEIYRESSTETAYCNRPEVLTLGINQIEEQPKPGVREREKHRGAESYRSGDPLRVSCPRMNM